MRMIGVSESQRPGRYQRSGNGLLGAMLITVVAVVGFVGFRALVSDEPDVKPEDVDYLEIVGQAQDAEHRAGVPGRPARGLDRDPRGGAARRPAGLRPGHAHRRRAVRGPGLVGEPIDDLLAERVDDEDVEDADPLTVEGSVAQQWDGYADPGGDLAYAAEVGDHSVLVYGSASEEDLRAVVESLTTAPLAR